MKELSVEEKAKRYDEIIEKANKMHCENCEACQMCIEELIPELAESEDERIRKGLIALIKECLIPPTLFRFGLNKEDTVAWLEAQGEHANFRNKIQIGDKVTRNKDGVLVNLSQLNRVAKKDEKQGEQPKKHDVCDNCDQQGCCVSPCPMKLVEKHGEKKPNYCHHEVDLSECSEEYRKAYYDGWNNCNQQHAQLKAEQKPAAWSVEDEKMLKDTIRFCELCGNQVSANWLKSLRPQNRWKPSDEQIKKDINKAANEWECKASFSPIAMVMDGDRPIGTKQHITSHADSFKAGVDWVIKKLRE